MWEKHGFTPPLIEQYSIFKPTQIFFKNAKFRDKCLKSCTCFNVNSWCRYSVYTNYWSNQLKKSQTTWIQVETYIISHVLTNVWSSNLNVQISNQYSSDFRHRLKVKTANCCPDHSLVISVSMRLESYVCLAISASLHCFNESNSYNPNGLQHEIVPRSKTMGNNCLIQPGCGHRYKT